MLVVVVADVDCFGAVVGELVGTGAAYAVWRVGSCISLVVSCRWCFEGKRTGHDYYLVFCSAIDQGQFGTQDLLTRRYGLISGSLKGWR